MNKRTFFLAFLLSTIAVAGPKTTKRLSPADLDRAVRDAVSASSPKLPKKASIKGVRGPSSPEVPANPTRIAIEVTPPPRRAGIVAANGILVFYKDTDVVARIPVTLDLDVPAEGATYDVPKGSAVTLVVQHGSVEITAPAVTSADADVGDTVQCLLKPSGRAFKTKLVAKDRAQVVE